VADQQISIDIFKGGQLKKGGNTLPERALLLKPLIATLLKKISRSSFHNPARSFTTLGIAYSFAVYLLH